MAQRLLGRGREESCLGPQKRKGCVKTRTVKGSDVAGMEGQGRCLAYLYCWAVCCPAGCNCQHNHVWLIDWAGPSVDQRQAARDAINASTDPAVVFLRGPDVERQKRDDEPDEPLYSP